MNLNYLIKRKLKLIYVEFSYHKRVLTNKRLSFKKKFKHFISMITRRCSGKGTRCCGGWAYLEHSNCAYEDELSNYNYCCKDCHEEIDRLYQEMWDDYYSGRL